jgi:hypothetical protein
MFLVGADRHFFTVISASRSSVKLSRITVESNRRCSVFKIGVGPSCTAESVGCGHVARDENDACYVLTCNAGVQPVSRRPRYNEGSLH